MFLYSKPSECCETETVPIVSVTVTELDDIPVFNYLTVWTSTPSDFRISVQEQRLDGDGSRSLQEGSETGSGEADAGRDVRARRSRAAALRPPARAARPRRRPRRAPGHQSAAFHLERRRGGERIVGGRAQLRRAAEGAVRTVPRGISRLRRGRRRGPPALPALHGRREAREPRASRHRLHEEGRQAARRRAPLQVPAAASRPPHRRLRRGGCAQSGARESHGALRGGDDSDLSRASRPEDQRIPFRRRQSGRRPRGDGGHRRGRRSRQCAADAVRQAGAGRGERDGRRPERGASVALRAGGGGGRAGSEGSPRRRPALRAPRPRPPLARRHAARLLGPVPFDVCRATSELLVYPQYKIHFSASTRDSV